MADEDDSLRLRENRPAEESTSISPEQLPLENQNHPEPASEASHSFRVPRSRSEKVASSSQQPLDIDELVSRSETLEVDIYEYLHQLEGEARRRPQPDYLEKVQKANAIDVTDVRTIFVDWVVKVAEQCKLPQYLLHLTISNIDRYLSVNDVDRQMLQILGVSSMLISLKYEYKCHPSATDLCNTTGAKCTNLDVVKMEYEILKTLEFEMGNPTTKTFLRKLTRVAQEEDNIYNLQLEFLADYLADLSLLEYKCLKFLPSLVAASVVFLSRYTIKTELRPWSSALQQESGYEPANLEECVRLIHDWQVRKKGGGIINAVRNKYKQHALVSGLSPATISAFLLDDTTSMVDQEDSEGLVAKETVAVDQFEYLEWFEVFAGPSPDYMEKVQKDFTSDFRAIFVDWVIKVAEKCKLRSDLLHQTVSYIDRYLSVKAVDRQRLQLLGVSSMLISLKYEYKGHPSAADLCNITGAKCTNLEVVKMEAEILKSLKFEMGHPTIKTFLGKFTRVAQEEDNSSDLQLDFLCDYLAELSLLEYKCIKFLPSLVAASVVFLSRFTIESESPPWSTALIEESEYAAYNLEECVLLIHDWQMGKRDGDILNAVKNKYKQPEFKCVSELSPPDTIPAIYFEEFEDYSP